MSDDDIRRKKDASSAPEGTGKTPANAAAGSGETQDEFVKVLREIPRMRSIAEAEEGPVRLPPPLMARFGAVTQGCGGILLTLLAIPMLMVAAGAGFAVWGPGLFLVAGFLLVFGTGGLWQGKLLPLVVSIPIIVLLATLFFYWETFIPAVVWLAPLGDLRLLYDVGARIASLVLVATLILHAVNAFGWRRLHMASRRGLILWAVVAIGLAALAIAFHVLQMQQREDWLTTHRDDWTAEAADGDPVLLGTNAYVTLSNSFISLEAENDDDVPIDRRLAELAANVDAGVSVLRIGASSDVLLEYEGIQNLEAGRTEGTKARIFIEDDVSEEDLPEKLAEAQDRAQRQQAFEQTYLEDLLASDPDLQFIVSDAQYSPYFLVQANDEENISWREFTRMHADRIRYYVSGEPYESLVDPAVMDAFRGRILAYEVVTEPSAYGTNSGIEEPTDETARLDAWVIHTEELIAIVKEANPAIRVGVTVGLQADFDRAYYEAVLGLDGLDFIGVRIYQMAAFEDLEDLIAQYGHPNEFGKELWITETWFGYCIAPQRSTEHDSLWLEAAVAFAGKESVTAVMASDYGCFIQQGGTFFSSDIDETDRTGTWETWRTLVAEEGDVVLSEPPAYVPAGDESGEAAGDGAGDDAGDTPDDAAGDDTPPADADSGSGTTDGAG